MTPGSNYFIISDLMFQKVHRLSQSLNSTRKRLGTSYPTLSDLRQISIYMWREQSLQFLL